MNACPSTGLVPVDDDHRKILNELDDLRVLDKAELGTIELLDRFDGILEHARNHFAEEERIMANISFPLLGPHAEEHRVLLTEVETFRANVGLDMTPDEWNGVVDFLAHWFTGHITQSDRLLFVYISQGPSVFAENPITI
ncbi:MAG: bacteriohemerythrin [Magnetovibrionaceae bacterium]